MSVLYVFLHGRFRTASMRNIKSFSNWNSRIPRCLPLFPLAPRVLRSSNFRREHFLRGRVSGRRAKRCNLVGRSLSIDKSLWSIYRMKISFCTACANSTRISHGKILSRWKTHGTTSFFLRIYLSVWRARSSKERCLSSTAARTWRLLRTSCHARLFLSPLFFSFFYELRVRRR